MSRPFSYNDENFTVIYKDGKYYLSTRNAISQKYYATAFLFLKDI